MKAAILTLIAVLTLASLTAARPVDSISLRVGQQKFVTKGKLTVKFLSVVEDSRCPINARCIWAGNAKVRISVANGRSAARFIELNSGLEPQTATAYGHKFTLEGLSPHPGEPKGRVVATIGIDNPAR